MFSNDQNIERIANLVEESKEWIEIKAQYARLSIVEKIVKILTVLTLSLVLGAISIVFVTIMTFAGAIALGKVLDSTALGFLIAGGAYFLLFLAVIMMRRPLIEKPLVRFFISILAENIDGDNVLENIKTDSEKEEKV